MDVCWLFVFVIVIACVVETETEFVAVVANSCSSIEVIIELEKATRIHSRKAIDPR